MDDLREEIEALGIDVIDLKQADGEISFKSYAIDRLGPLRLNEILFSAFNAGKLQISPFEIYVSTARVERRVPRTSAASLNAS